MKNEKSIKEIAPVILAEIKAAKNILMHCHPSPDPDSVASALAMKIVLEGMGKKAMIISGDSKTPQAFMHFPGARDIVQKNFFEVDLGDFDLFIILDTAAPGMISRLRPIKFPLAVRTIAIDHHISNPLFADLNFVSRSPATAFILYSLFKEWNIDITHDIATNLFIGMYDDTGGFKYNGTDYQVLRAAADLAFIAPDFIETIFVLENSNTKEAIYFDMIAMNSIQTYLNDRLVIASVSSKDLAAKNVSPDEASNSEIDNILKSVIGWNISVLMTEIEPNTIKISIRTRDCNKFDVSRLATALGGGGHRAASGAMLAMSLDDAKKAIVTKAKELYNL